jgi:hypothetical protein
MIPKKYAAGTRIAAVAAAGFALLVALAAGAPPAAAHEGEGALALQVADPPAPTGPGSVRYQVLLTFLNDGHPAPDATVTAVAEQSGATGRVGPLTMAPGTAEGTYEATVAFPSAGTWTVRFTAVTPPALLELAQEVQPAASVATTSAAPTTSAADTSAATTSTIFGPTSGGAEGGDEGGDDEGGSSWLPIAVAVLIAAAVSMGARAFVRSRRT